MSTVLAPTRVQVQAKNDIVVFSIGRAQTSLGYETALKIAQGLRLASNLAGRYAGIHLDERRELKRTPEVEAPVAPGGVNTAPRNAGLPWTVNVVGELVEFTLGEFSARFQAPDAATVAGWLRAQAKVAKAWAGDTSKTLRLAGNLTDAETNDRLIN